MGEICFMDFMIRISKIESESSGALAWVRLTCYLHEITIIFFQIDISSFDMKRPFAASFLKYHLTRMWSSKNL